MNRIGPKLHSDRPKVVAFGGGKGGTGRSTLCAEVARSMARQNQRVLCIDASWSCPTLNVLLHAEEPSFDFSSGQAAPIGEEGSHIADFIVDTGTDGVWLANIAAARHFPFVRPRLGADALIGQMHELDFEWILIDLSPGLDPLDVGLFTLSDIPVIVCSPEPASVRMSTQYLRSAFYQAIGYHPEAPQARDEVLEMLYEQPLDLNLNSLLDSAYGSEQAAHVVLDTGRRFETYLVVNLVREGSERDLGYVVCHAWHQELNIFPRVLASVDYEDRRWFYNRRTTGLGPGRGDEALSKDTEALAKNLLDVSLIDARFPRPVPRGTDAHPALQLGISPETGRNEVRQHCRRLWEGYRRENTISLVFSNPNDRQTIADELETLYRQVLTMPNESFNSQQNATGPRSSATGRPMPAKPERPKPKAAPSPVRTQAPPEPPEVDASDEVDEEPDEPSVEPRRTSEEPDGVGDEPSQLAQLRSDVESPGELIASLRRQADMSLHDLSQRTHIGIKYLAAIEDADLEVLPRTVYLRGYLREIARIFDVEAQPLIEEYFRYLESE